MRKYIYLLFPLLLISCSGSKTSRLYDTYNTHDYLYWSDSRKLSWQDFQGEPAGDKDLLCEALFKVPSSAGTANIFSKKELTIITVFDKKRSWVKKEAVNDKRLLYNQVVFDIHELYARKLRKEFNETKIYAEDIAVEFHRMNEENNRRLKNELTKFGVLSKLGESDPVIKEWAREINKRLNELINYKVIYKK